jgi:hypothetical protein
VNNELGKDMEGNGCALILATALAGAKTVCEKLRKTCVTIAFLKAKI